MNYNDRALINHALDETDRLVDRLDTLPGSADRRGDELRSIHNEFVLLTHRTAGVLVRAARPVVHLPVVNWRWSHPAIRVALTQFLHGFRKELDHLVQR
jgi:hypothetical protein